MLSQMMVVDAESYDPLEMSTRPVGTGPYVVTDYVVTSHTTVKARDEYWGEKPSIANINFKCLNEDSQIVNALETHEVDIARVPTADAEYVKSMEYSIAESNTGMCITAYYNMSPSSPLATKEARYAVDYATDRQSILDVVFGGYGAVTSWPVSDACIDYEDRFGGLHETYSKGYDLDKAKELAEQSGLTGKTLRIITNGTSDYITIAEIMQASLLEIGVKTEIMNYDQATYFSLLVDESNFEIALYATSAPSMMAGDIFAGTLSFSLYGWEGPESDAFTNMYKQILGTFDPKEYSDKLFEFAKTFEDVSLWYGICDSLTLWAFANDIQGAEFSLTGIVGFQDLSFASS
jgi:peptide/nickel transport system substrate-binding protein